MCKNGIILRHLALAVLKILLYYHLLERYRQDLHATGKYAEGLWQYAIELDPRLVVHTLACVANHQWHPATPFGDSAVTVLFILFIQLALQHLQVQ